MKLDDNKEMVAMLDHAKGSLENKIRQAYNSGYKDGFEQGKSVAVQMLERTLMDMTETHDLHTETHECVKTEPKEVTISAEEYTKLCRMSSEQRRILQLFDNDGNPITDCSWK